MLIGNSMKIKLKQYVSQAVNAISIRDDHMNPRQKQQMNSIIKTHSDLFSEPNEKLTYTTKVIAEIRTTSDTPVYSKSYPYPMSLKEETEKQIEQMLGDGIIRRSRSPYNSPVWIVPKKQDASGKKKYRMVIDYRKLNKVTIADRYPIPEINEVLSQLGQNNFFSVLDLKSGFHPLKETDMEKTAFSVNNGKFEFTRLPFGFKNAPSIFQRALDDILREHIGKICYVYIDDIIIFSKNEESHAHNIEKIVQTLKEANMKVQLDKCEFFKQQVEFLGFIVSPEGIKTNSSKVEAIVNFAYPKTLKDLRSFLGLSGYYRKFIQDYAKIAKPLTSLLRGEEGRISKTQSQEQPITLDSNGKIAFNQIKNALVSEEVVLTYPDYNNEFHLTTDASNYALGAVLEQKGKPITYISRTLTKTEENYAANEKEMLAIIWALNSLRNYLYGAARVKIFTDHQPLTYALSNKNNNAKLKRWKAILEEYNYELAYKPGKTNLVADALSRPPQINSMSTITHSDESSSHNLIPSVNAPINVFKKQIFILTGQQQQQNYNFSIPFPTYHRHVTTQQNYSEQDLIKLLKKCLNPSVINGIFTSEHIMGMIQNIYPHHFSVIKARLTQSQVKDLITETEQQEQIILEHRRAHRNSEENKKQLLENFYFPKMLKKIKQIVKQCIICQKQKYERHPNKPEIKPTPIPQYPGQILHIDIYIAEKKLVLSAIDKFSKYAQAKILKSRAVEDIKEPLRQLLISFGIPETIVLDNEKALNSASITFMLEDQYKIKVYRTPPYTSSVNGQVERLHSTLSEILRCLKEENMFTTFEELLDNAMYKYNYTIHSTTKHKPDELFFGRRVSTDPNLYEQIKQQNIKRLEDKQETDLKFHNKNRQPLKNYNPGQTIYVKINKRQGTKLTPRFKSEVVKENKTTTVITESGKIIHKSLIRN